MSIARARTFRRAMSPPEARLWMALRDPLLRPHHFRRQVPFGPYYADFASHPARLIVEVDGGMHFTDEVQARDARRDAFLMAQGYRVLRFTSVDVFDHMDGVVTAILSAMPQPPPTA